MRLGRANLVLQSWDLRCSHREGCSAKAQDSAAATGVRKQEVLGAEPQGHPSHVICEANVS